jgi:L-threonylcarbamoyladenylate synthase
VNRGGARIYRGTPRNLAALARRLREGELVAVPTETVYGLAADALDAGACRKIFKAKGRPSSDPLIVHISSWRELVRVAVPNPAAERLARKFWPGPLTLVLPKRPEVPGVVTAGLDSVAVRMPAHPLLRRLLRLAGRPLAAPSANPFGYVSPTSAEHVRRDLGRRIRHILDGGPSRIGVESTIVDLRDPRRPRLLRPGAIGRSEISRALGTPVPAPRDGSRRGAQLAPGRLPRHYSPRTPLSVHDRLPADGPAREARLFVARPAGRRTKNLFWLSETGDLKAAARKLFAQLRKIDAAGFERIHAELARGGALAEAINDRLRRAAAKS